MGWIALTGLVFGILGARLTEWMVSHSAVLAANPSLALNPETGGRTLIGGVIAGWLGVELAKWRLGIRRSTGDMFALALPAGEIFGRIGCYLNGCCIGISSSVPWAVYQHGAWRHPAQLYSAATAAVILIVLLAVKNRLPSEGDLFKCYLLSYGVGRFSLEFVRDRTIALAGLSLAQMICLEMALMASITLIVSARRPSRKAAGV